MRDIPFFTTETGVSSLSLKEVPYRAAAYIHIRDVQPEGLVEHLNECVRFCRMAGAEKIYAEGYPGLEAYPPYTTVLEMRGTAWVDQEKLACLFPVTEATVSRWREIYNRAMEAVDNASTLEARDEKRITDSGGAYFVHRDGKLLGIGWLEDTKLLALAAAERGAGDVVLHTLMSLVEGAQMTLEVASTNHRALALYERAGFLTVGESLRWYQVG